MRERDVIMSNVEYDPGTGAFTWRTSTRGHKAGAVAGSRHKGTGYVSLSIAGRRYLAHRLAWYAVYGEWPPEGIDHINGVRHDNSIANLRPATRSQNQQNLRVAMRNSGTGLLGAFHHKSTGKFMAQIAHEGRQMYLGLHATPEAAHSAYLAAKARLHPYQTIVAKGNS